MIGDYKFHLADDMPQ